MDQPSQAHIGQIDPSTMTPYPYPCFATTPTPRNWVTCGEPPSNSGDRFFLPAEPPSRPPNAVSPSLVGTWAHAHGTVPAPLPLAGRVGPPARPRGHARERARWAEIPPGLANQETFSFFLFPYLFSYFHIYVYMLIFYAPKIVQIFSKSHNNNIWNLTHFAKPQWLM
jgi:hypothetical protein